MSSPSIDKLEQLYEEGWNWSVSHTKATQYECRIWKPKLHGKLFVKTWPYNGSLKEAVDDTINFIQKEYQ
jgi:hypothetical protein